MSRGLDRLAAKLIEGGMKIDWLRSLKSSPQTFSDSGIKRNSLRHLKDLAILRKIPHEKTNEAAKWAPGAQYPSFLGAAERVGGRQ